MSLFFSVKEREGFDAGRIEGRSVTDKLIRHSFLRFHKPHKKIIHYYTLLYMEALKKGIDNVLEHVPCTKQCRERRQREKEDRKREEEGRARLLPQFDAEGKKTKGGRRRTKRKRTKRKYSRRK